MNSGLWLKELGTPNSPAELPEVVLTRAKDGKTFKGPGSVVRNSDGRLALKFYSPAEFNDGLGLIDVPPGTVVPGQDFFDLEAVDMHGHYWRCEGIWPHVSVSLPTGSAVIHGEPYRLVGIRSTKPRDPSHIAMAFRSNVKFPVNQREQTERKLGDTLLSARYSQSAAELEFDGLKVRVFRDEEALIVQVSGDWTGDKAEDFSPLVVNALQFMLGCRLQADVITLTSEDIRTQHIQDTVRDRLRSKIEPPRHWRSVADEGVTWKVFMAFLRYVRAAPTSQATELCRWVSEVIDTGSAPLEVSGLVLSVAVEGIVGLLQGKESVDEALLKEIEAALAVAKVADFPAALKQRIVGAIEAMKRPRAQDYLKQLVEQGVIPAGHIEAWKGLRNASAHAHAFEGDWVEPTVRKSSVVLALYYRLVFLLIGYRGPYTDYSLLGWPERSLTTD